MYNFDDLFKIPYKRGQELKIQFYGTIFTIFYSYSYSPPSILFTLNFVQIQLNR